MNQYPSNNYQNNQNNPYPPYQPVPPTQGNAQYNPYGQGNQYNQYNQYNNPNAQNPYQQYGYTNPYYQRQYSPELQNMMQESALRRKEKNSLILSGVVIGGALILQLVIEVVFIMLLRVLKLDSIYNTSATFQNCFNVIVVDLFGLGVPFTIAALILKKNFREASVPLIPTEKLGAAKTAAWTALGMGSCVIGNIVTNAVIKLFDLLGYELTQPEMAKPDGIVALIAGVIAVAVAPALFEEYAMRCVSLGVLRKYGKAFAVIAVSVVFGLIHGNLIQFVFAFIVGLVLGYVTVRTDSIVPAIIIHGCNNGISVVGDFVKYYVSDKTAETVQNYIIFAWAALAVGGLIYLIVKHALLPDKSKADSAPKSRLSFGAKLACLLPGFSVPFLILIGFTSQYIQKK